MPPPSLHSHRGSSPPPPSKPKEKLLSLLLKPIIMMLLISFFVLLLPLASFFLLLPLFLRHHRHRPHPLHSSGLSPEQLKKVPQFRFPPEPKATNLEPDSCVICLDGFRQGQWCRNLVGCGHFFHSKCLDSWLIKIAACPICRTRVSSDSEDKPMWGFDTRRTEQSFRVC